MAAATTCPSCGRRVPPGAETCPFDDTPLVDFPEKSTTAKRTAALPQTEPAAGPDPGGNDPLPGTSLGEYQVLEPIGVGGMGIVYRGVQPVIQKPVAIKVLRRELAQDAEHMQRLLAEARTVTAIRHRGIVDVFGFGQTPDGRHYLVMEFLEGEPLDKIITQRAPLPVAEVLTVLDGVLDALGAAHGVGVVHRDLKPSNVFVVTPPYGPKYVKLLDFGLAKRAQGPGAATGAAPLTRANMIVGTPEYMAPEQAMMQPVGPATDLYALGVVGFEMLTKRLPFEGDQIFELINHHIRTPPPRVAAFEPSVPEALDDFVQQLLQKKAAGRPRSVAVAQQQLRRIQKQLQTSATQLGAKAASLELKETFVPGRNPARAEPVRHPQGPAAVARPGVAGRPPAPRPSSAPTPDMRAPRPAREPAAEAPGPRGVPPWVVGVGAAAMVGVAGGVFLALRSVSAPSPVPARAPPPSPPATPAAPAHSADVPQVSEHLAPTATAEPIPPAPTELGPGGAPSASPAAATPPPTVTPSSPVTNSPPIPLPTPAARPLADRPAVRPVPASPRRPAEREGSRDALNARIKQIEDRMYAADNSGTPLGASVWRMFNEAKEAAGSATTPEERKAVASSLEQIEWKLPPAP